MHSKASLNILRHKASITKFSERRENFRSYPFAFHGCLWYGRYSLFILSIFSFSFSFSLPLAFTHKRLFSLCLFPPLPSLPHPLLPLPSQRQFSFDVSNPTTTNVFLFLHSYAFSSPTLNFSLEFVGTGENLKIGIVSLVVYLALLMKSHSVGTHDFEYVGSVYGFVASFQKISCDNYHKLFIYL